MPPAFQPPLPLRNFATLSIRHFAPPVRNPKTPHSLVAPPHIPPPCNIAILGGGLAGLATAYHLKVSTNRFLRKRGITPPTVTLITPHPATTGASAAAAGLLHPFTPRVKKLVWRGRRGVAATEHLLRAVEHLSDAPIYHQHGLLRLAVQQRLIPDFLAAANRFPADVQYLDPSETAHRFPHVNPLPAAFLPNAYVVDTRAYMAALWRRVRQLGVLWLPESFATVRHLLGRDRGRYDTVIVCTGAETRAIDDLAHVPVTPCRGQNVRLNPTVDLPSVPVIGGKYVIPDFFGHGVLAGATFEYPDDQPMEQYLREGAKTHPAKAIEEIREPVERLVPRLFNNAEVLGAWAGLRALPPRSSVGSVPIACRVRGLEDDVSAWVLTGLGSRGLLHHAYLGRMMAHAVVAGNETLLPFDTRRYEITLGGQQMDGVGEEFAAAALHSQ